MIHKAVLHDVSALTDLAMLLWPDNDISDLSAEIAETLGSSDAVFFIYSINNTAAGFAQCGLRNDYVEGTDSCPVGYLEGIFVKEEHRHLGIARQLLASGERWAKQKGCREFASDCLLDNKVSFDFHMKMGFEEANRIICFKKNL